MWDAFGFEGVELLRVVSVVGTGAMVRNEGSMLYSQKLGAFIWFYHCGRKNRSSSRNVVSLRQKLFGLHLPSSEIRYKIHTPWLDSGGTSGSLIVALGVIMSQEIRKIDNKRSLPGPSGSRRSQFDLYHVRSREIRHLPFMGCSCILYVGGGRVSTPNMIRPTGLESLYSHPIKFRIPLSLSIMLITNA